MPNRPEEPEDPPVGNTTGEFGEFVYAPYIPLSVSSVNEQGYIQRTYSSLPSRTQMEDSDLFRELLGREERELKNRDLRSLLDRIADRREEDNNAPY